MPVMAARIEQMRCRSPRRDTCGRNVFGTLEYVHSWVGLQRLVPDAPRGRPLVPATDPSKVRVWNGPKILSSSRNIGPPLWFDKQRHSRSNQASARLGQARGPYPQILRK